VACLLCALIPNGEFGTISASLRIITAVMGKFGVASAFALLFVYTTELFPTVVRNAALGANSSVARIGGIAAPMVVLLAEVMHAGWLSFVVFGLTSIFAGAHMAAAVIIRLACLAPDTLLVMRQTPTVGKNCSFNLSVQCMTVGMAVLE
jgi:hypothetical protein